MSTDAFVRLTTAKSLLNTINKNFGTLPFCRRYLDRIGEQRYLLAVSCSARSAIPWFTDIVVKLNHLVQQGIVQDYPPLYDQKGAMTAQFVSTVLCPVICVNTDRVLFFRRSTRSYYVPHGRRWSAGATTTEQHLCIAAPCTPYYTRLALLYLYAPHCDHIACKFFWYNTFGE